MNARIALAVEDVRERESRGARKDRRRILWRDAGRGAIGFLAVWLSAAPMAIPGSARASAAASPLESGESQLFSVASPVGPIGYVPGRGVRIESAGLAMGGFVNVKAEDARESGGEFSVDDLDVFFILDRFDRFRAVADFQMKDIFVANDQHAGSHDFAFDVRRLFGDFRFTDELAVRAGTFLTPVGYWNLLRAPPLTWTTEPPLIVEETFFQPTTTGLMLHGSTEAMGGRFAYSLFSQLAKPIERDPDLHPPDRTAALRLEYDADHGWSAEAVYQASENDSHWAHLGGAHIVWRYRRGEVLSELYYQNGDHLVGTSAHTSSSQWGTYVQGALRAWGPLYLVGRYEHFDPPSGAAVNVFTVGGVVKPFPFAALKIEYRVADRRLAEETLDGFFSSATVLF